MSKSPSYKPEIEELGIRQMPSVAPVAPLENFRDPSATIRVLDEVQPNIVGVTREGRSAMADAFAATSMGYGWQYSTIVNGQEQDPGYGANVLGHANTLGFGREGSPDVVRVTPKINLEVIGNNQLRVTWTNMNTSQGACWIRGGWLGDRIVWNAEGSSILNVPYTSGDPKFDQIGISVPGWGTTWTGITFRIQGGHFTQVPNGSEYTLGSWASWNRTVPNNDVDILFMKNNGTSDISIAGTQVLPGKTLAHPGRNEDLAFTWTSQAAGTANIGALLQDAQPTMGDGITYTIRKVKADGTETTVLSTGLVANGGTLNIPEGNLSVAVGVGDKIQLIMNGRGTTNNPEDVKGDGYLTEMAVHLTEAEKTYEKVTVAPSIQLRTASEGNTLMVDYRNIPEGMKLRAHKRGTEWNDGNWGKWEITLPTGSGSVWVPVQGNTDAPQHVIDVYLVDSNSDNEAIEEKKLTFNYKTTLNTGRMADVPTNRIFAPSRPIDVLKDPETIKSDVDFVEETTVRVYEQSLTEAPPERNWTDGINFNYETKAHQFGVQTMRDIMEEPLVGTGGLYKVLVPTSTTSYERHDIFTDGNATMERIWYIKNDGLYKLPHEYYVRLPNGSVILKPNCPPFVVYDLRLTGAFARGGEQAESIEPLLPMEGQHVDAWIDRISPQPVEQPGWSGMTLDIQQSQSAVLMPGTMVGLSGQIRSIGSVGDLVKLRVYCGYTGNVATDQLQSTLEKVIPAGGRFGFHANAYAPLGPSSDTRGIITLEVEYADGRREVVISRRTRALSMDAHESATRAAALQGSYVTAMRQAREATVAYLQSIGQPVPSSLYDDISTTRTLLDSLITDGIGGGPGDTLKVRGAWENEEQIYNTEALNWFDSSKSVPGLSETGITITGETMLGKILKGFLQKYNSGSSSQVKNTLIGKLSDITGIGIEKIKVIDGYSTASSRAVALKKLFEEAQYERVFNTQAPQDIVTFAATNKYDGHTPSDPEMDVYRDFDLDDYSADSSVKVRFDIKPQSGMTSYDHVDAYLINATNGQELGRLTPTSIKDGLFISIPLQRLVPFATEQVRGGPELDIRGGKFKVKLVAWFSNQSGAPGEPAFSNTFSFEHDALGTPEMPLGDVDLSLASPTNPLRQSEVNYLKRMHFPMDGNDWNYSIYSGFHADTGLFALDFNAPNDQKREVKAPISGRISYVNLQKGTVIIETVLPTGKTAKTTFHHLVDILENKIGQEYEGIEEAIRRLDLRTRYASDINAYLQTHGGTNSPMTSTVFDAIQTIPNARAELSPTLNRIAEVQGIIDSMISAGQLTIGAADPMAACGNEGLSTGSHVHVNSSIDNQPVNLFAWADAWRNGIQVGTDINGPTNGIPFVFDATAKALVNHQQGLVLLRSQQGESGVNLVYAWTSSFDKDNTATQEQVVWKQKIFIDENGTLQNKHTWVKKSDENYRWDLISQQFILLLPN